MCIASMQSIELEGHACESDKFPITLARAISCLMNYTIIDKFVFTFSKLVVPIIEHMNMLSIFVESA